MNDELALKCKLALILAILMLLQACGSPKKHGSEAVVRLQPAGSLQHVKLKKDYAYYLFTCNNRFLVWYEGYTHTVFIYNLAAEKLKKQVLKKGRGPHEFLAISGLSISENDTISLVDANNVKIIRMKPTGQFMPDYNPPSGIRPMRIVSRNTFTVISNPTSSKALYFLWNNSQMVPLKMNDTPLEKEFPYLFSKESSMAIVDDRLIQLPRFYPSLYMYDLNDHRETKKITYDKSHIKWGQPKNKKGVKYQLPPEKADIINEDVAPVPGLAHRVFLLARGAGEKRKYGLNTLFEFNLKNERFVGVDTLNFKANEITVNEKDLFIYSKDQNKIYRYIIVHGE